MAAEKDLDQVLSVNSLDFFRVIVGATGVSGNAPIGSLLNNLGVLRNRGIIDQSFNVLANGIWNFYGASALEGNPGFYFGTVISFIGDRQFGFQLAFNQIPYAPIIRFRIKDNEGDYGDWRSISFT